MARTVDVITTEIQTNIRTNVTLNSFKFVSEGGSPVSVFNLIISTIAISIYTFEVILDTMKATVSAIAAAAPAGNAAWIRNQILNFQFGYTVTLTNYVPGYSTIDTSARIVTQCSVQDAGSGVITIKVATGSNPPFTPLTAPQLSALKDYYNGTSTSQGVGFAGVKASFITLSPDRLYISANIYYFGQYVGTTVQANVITAITSFLSSFSGQAFDGKVYMIRLVDAIQAVPGVNRVSLLQIVARPNSSAFSLTSNTNVDIQGFYSTVAGHIIPEDTAGQTLSTTLNMILEV